MGFYFQGYYYDKCQPMGCSSSCKNFESFSSAIQWILHHKYGVTNVVKVLDDFLFVEPSQQQCQYNLDKFQQICQNLNVPIAAHKTVGPEPSLTLLGIKLDASAMTTSLPTDQLIAYTADLNDVLTRKKVTLRSLKLLIGKLQFATSVILSGRAFLRRLHDLTIGVSKPFHFIRLNAQTKLDLKMWLSFMQHYNGRTLISYKPSHDSSTLYLYSDASK